MSDGILDYNGIDQIVRSESSVISTNGLTLLRTVTSQWLTNNSNVPTTVGIHNKSLTTHESWSEVFGLTIYANRIDAGSGFQVLTNRNPDNSYAVLASTNGLQLFQASYDASGDQIKRQDFVYDEFDRIVGQSDARNGETTLSYDDAGRLVSASSRLHRRIPCC